MKKLILHFIFLAVLNIPSFAQPQAFKYSALAIGADGQPITADICVRFTLHEDSENGTVRYVEIHQANPGEQGKFNLDVGRGTPSSSFGPFTSLDWANHQYWMRVALSFDCIDFTTQGVSQLLSVPYALYAAKSGSAENDSDTDATNELQELYLNGTTIGLSQGGGEITLPQDSDAQTLSLTGRQLSISNGNTINLPAEADADPSNELQNLSLNGNVLFLSQGGGAISLPLNTDSQSLSIAGNQLTISGGNTITLPADEDGDPANEIQKISIDGNTIHLSQNGGSVALPPEQDGDPDNEIQELVINGNTITLSRNGGSITLPAGTDSQSLSLNGNQLTISGGNTIALPADADGDPANEIQELSIDGNTILLSQDGGSITLPVGTDSQALSIDGDQLTISGGNTITLPADADGDPSNEIQELSIDGNTILLSQDGGSITLPVGTDSQALSIDGDQLTISGGNTITLPAEEDGDPANEIQELSIDGNTIHLSQDGGSVTLPASVAEVIGGQGISTTSSGGSTTVNAENTAPIWNAGQLQGHDISDAFPASPRVLVYDPAQGNGEFGYSSADSDISVEANKVLKVSRIQNLPIDFSGGLQPGMVLTCIDDGGSLQLEGKIPVDGLTLPYSKNVNLDVPMFSVTNNNIITPDLIGMQVDNRGRYGIKGISREGQSNFNSNLSAFDNSSFTYPAAVFGEHINSSEAGVGVFGKAVSSFDSEGIGGLFMGKHSGVLAVAYDGGLAAVVGYGAGTRAGYFRGDVRMTDNLQIDDNLDVLGSVNSNVKNFKIDHPQDPANKYLYHTSVESPDMKNIYDGLATTDTDGYATVELPPYFDALNKDCRYQLTCIGEFAQAIIAKKVENNRFVIRTDKPHVEVSWQVTGIRKDPYAEAYRTVPEVEKPADEKGTYLQPELYGQPEGKRLGGE